jgi:hypothetical protein
MRESGAQGEFVQRVQTIISGRLKELPGFGGGEGLEATGRGVVVVTLRATLRGSSSSRTARSRADLRTAWTYVTVSRDSRLSQHWPMAQQDRRTTSRSWAQHWQVVRSPSRKVRTSRVVSRASFFVPRPGLRWRRMEAAYRVWVFSRRWCTATPSASTGLAGDNLSLEWRTSEPDPEEEPRLVDGVVDNEFWGSVRAAADGLVLLCERWAHGAYGCRWFRVTAENTTEVAQVVRSRSLLCIVANPDLRLDAGLLDEDFTAFEAPLTPGQLICRAHPGGADSLAEVAGRGFSFMLADAVLAGWCSVVPDSDGVVRAAWESPVEG